MNDLHYKIIKKAFEYRDSAVELSQKLIKMSDEELKNIDQKFVESNLKGSSTSEELFILLDEFEAKEGRPS